MKNEISQLEATLRDIEKDLENLLLTIPNLLSDDVPFWNKTKQTMSKFIDGEK